MFKNKTLLITGGTGSFGNAVLRKFLSTDIKEIRIFSRDELKQDNMRKKYDDEKLKFYIGDVRDKNSINDAMRGVDFVFHAAALKQCQMRMTRSKSGGLWNSKGVKISPSVNKTATSRTT